MSALTPEGRVGLEEAKKQSTYSKHLEGVSSFGRGKSDVMGADTNCCRTLARHQAKTMNGNRISMTQGQLPVPGH